MAIDLQNLQKRFRTSGKPTPDPAGGDMDASLFADQASRTIDRPSQVMLSPEAAQAIAKNTGKPVQAKGYGGDIKIVDRGTRGLGSREGGTRAVVDRLFGFNPGVVKGTEVIGLFGDNPGVDPAASYYVPPTAPVLPGQPDTPSGFTPVPADVLKGLTKEGLDNFARRAFMMGAYDTASAAALLDGPDKATAGYLAARSELAKNLTDAETKKDAESLKRLESSMASFSEAATGFDSSAKTYAGAWATRAHPAFVALRTHGDELLGSARTLLDTVREAEKARQKLLGAAAKDVAPGSSQRRAMTSQSIIPIS